ncbi:uncharacterized protein LOC143522807 isoform X2 [Brachyhypopomus gauderio]|uniref:uncharacterized protein LOC143522807 isoform X2 n=1 Tax=Brachyhypopomus gauderio TaxID=698409 RepID=UPI0040417514
MGDSTVQWSPPAPPLPPDHVLDSGAVIFPGAFDQHGCPLVVFPVETQSKLVRELTEEEVSDFILYFLRLYNKSREECLLSVVADLREASVDVGRRVAETLLLLERRGRVVHSLYVVLPRKRGVSKHLHKLLHKLLLSGASRSPSSTPLKCIFIKDVFELSNYIDRSQLTTSLGGYLVYCHKSWVAFIKEMDCFARAFVTVVQRLPAYINALQDLSQLPVPVEAEPLSLFCSAHQTRLRQLRRDLGLDDLLTRCEQILEKFHCPESDPCYQAMVGTHLFSHTTLEMLRNYDRITAAVEKVELLWQQAFSKARLQLQVLSLQREAHQIMAQMGSELQGTLQTYRSEIRFEAPHNCSSAETLWLQFEGAVYPRAMALVRRAERVIQTLAELLPVGDGRVQEAWLSELEQETGRFHTAMELLHRKLWAACHYRHCYAKLQCWYSLAVCEGFLQDLLWSKCRSCDDPPLLGGQGGASPDWRSTLESFLRLHPCPRVEELMQLVQLARAVGEPQDAATQLAHRCMTLRKLMTSPGSATLRDLQLALQWQYDHLRGNHEAMTTTSNLGPGGSGCVERGAEGERSFPRDSGFSMCRSPCQNSVGLPKQEVLKDTPVFPTGIAAADFGKLSSLGSFDSGFDGTGHLETGSGREGLDGVLLNKGGISEPGALQSHIDNVNVPAVQSSSNQEQRVEEPDPDPPSIHIVPRITADSLNLEIQVKRSATLPKNPWLSLPVDNLENSYTVTISPRHQRVLQSAVPSEGSRDQPTQTDAQACDYGHHGAPQPPGALPRCHSLQEAELSPIRKVLSSTITDGAGRADTTAENTSTLQWDTYDLHDVKHDSSIRLLHSDVSLCDWELQEEAELQAVEEILDRTAGILQEEENALAQEEALDVLLNAEPLDRKWSAWSRHIQLTRMSSSDLAEAGVLGLEDDLNSHLQLSSNHEDILSQGCPDELGDGSAASPAPSSKSPDRRELQRELKNLQALDQQILEENLKLHALLHCEAEEMAAESSAQSCTEDRRRFLEELEYEKREVEEMERSLSREREVEEMEEESKGRRSKRQSSGWKVIKCSIMERASALINIGEEEEDEVGDEALLMSCRRWPQDTKHMRSRNKKEQCVTSEELTNHQPANAVTDEAFYSKLGTALVPIVNAESTNTTLNVNVVTCPDLVYSSLSSESDHVAPTAAKSECDTLDLPWREMSDSIRESHLSDLSDTRVNGEPETLLDRLELDDVPIGPTETLDTAELAQADAMEDLASQGSSKRTGTSDTQLEEGLMALEAGHERAFDPGGTGPRPRLPRLRPVLCDQANSVSEGDVQESGSHDPGCPGAPTVPSVFPKPKERKTPPWSRLQSPPADLGHNNNNNNPRCVDLHLSEHSVGSLLEKPTAEPDCVDGEQTDGATERGISEMEHLPCRGLISSVESEACERLTLEVEAGLSARRGEESEAMTPDSCVLTRTIHRSPELQPQLQICAREMNDFLTPVVLDTGSGLVKAGFADQDLPTTVFPTAIGMPKYEEVMSGSADRDVYVGHEAQHMRGVLTLQYPMRNGVISNWDHMELIWQHAFQQLRADPEDHPVLLTEGAMVPLENRQRTVQLMFETFNVPLTYVALQPVLALYAAGRTTGVVFDSGDGVSHTVPVFEGYSLPHAIQRLPLAGADVTLQLKRLLLEQGVCMRTSAELEIVREIKERCCFVALDYEAELGVGGAGTEMHYTLPDGQVVSLTTERFRASEILFKPELSGRDHYGMHESIFKSILQSDIDLRKSFLENVILSGGNTLLTGLSERLELELSRLSPADGPGGVRVLSPPQRDVSVWRGGAVLSSLPSFSSAWISRDEYEEFGPQIVFRKCF